MPEHVVFATVSFFALIAVLMLSFMPSDSANQMRINLNLPVDIGHVLSYALLAAATVLSVPGNRRTVQRGVRVIFAASILGLVIELLQPLVQRSAAFMDVVGNEVGIVCGISIASGYIFVDRVRLGYDTSRPGEG